MMRDIGRSIKPLHLLRRLPAFTIALCKFIRFQREMGGTLASVQMSICQLTLSTPLLIGALRCQNENILTFPAK